ncbi:MAG: hypothetical protein JEY96_13895 [Bacteroidales bacterium]|nr:hypothetical protein [Bacteroidales bacterium]
MKKILLILSTIYFVLNASAQAPDSFNFQSIITDQNNKAVTNQTISLRFSIIKDNPTGTEVYKETHTLSTNNYGVVTLKIGKGNVALGDFSTMEWGKNHYFLETAIDLSGKSNYEVLAVNQLLNTPKSIYSNKTRFAQELDYNTILNHPQIFITEEQSTKLDLISITESVNLDTLQNQVEDNSNMIYDEFPGFGTTAGTAYEILWSEINDSVYYNKGKVGIGVENTSNFGGAALHVGGGILHSNIPSKPKNGLMFYNNTFVHEFGMGTLAYYDELLNEQTFNVEHSLMYQWYFIDSTQQVPNKVILDDFIVSSNMGIGSNIEAGYNFNNNILALVDTTIRLKFWDTSLSTSFPTSDWTIEINDNYTGDANYFAITETTNLPAKVPFKITAHKSDNSYFIDKKGNVGIGKIDPLVKLDINGTLNASINGNGSQLTGIPSSGTSSTQNTGSTTIKADNDNDSNGEIIFQTQNSDKLIIANDGNIGIGKPVTTYKLDVAGDISIQDLNITNNLEFSGTLIHNVSLDSSLPEYGSLFIDVQGKSVIKIDPTAHSGAYFTNMKKGQKVTIININPTFFIIVNALSPSGIVLSQYDNATLIYNGTDWICTDQVL